MRSSDVTLIKHKIVDEGVLSVESTEPVMLLPRSRYHELIQLEEQQKLQNGKPDELMTEIKRLKKEVHQLKQNENELQIQNRALLCKQIEFNCISEEIQNLRKQNIELLIELSKFTFLPTEKLSGPLKTMIQELRTQGVGIKEIHIRIKRLIHPKISYNTVRKYIAELEDHNEKDINEE